MSRGCRMVDLSPVAFWSRLRQFSYGFQWPVKINSEIVIFFVLDPCGHTTMIRD